MTVALSAGGAVVSSDANAALIALYSAIAAGWQPPETVSEAEYHAAKMLPDCDPFKGYAGFCAAFGGKYFGGYARGAGRNWAGEGKRGLLRDCPGRTFHCLDWLSVDPFAGPFAIYADPPYAGTTGYSAIGAFDASRFAQRVREWSAFVDVFVSEYAFPFGDCVWSAPLTKRAGIGPGDTAIERLFYIAKGSLD